MGGIGIENFQETVINRGMHTNGFHLVETRVGSTKHLKGTRLGSNLFETGLCFKSPDIICAHIVDGWMDESGL